MKCVTIVSIGVVTLLVAMGWLQAENPVITSFSSNGRLTWTDSASTGVYQVEWASSLTSQWYCTWSDLYAIPTATSGVYVVNVPMFYRITWVSNWATVVTETNGVGDAIQCTFAGSLSRLPIAPGTVTIQARIEPTGDLEMFSDKDKNGLLYSSHVGNPTIGFVNYNNGAYSVQYLFPVVNDTTVITTYVGGGFSWPSLPTTGVVRTENVGVGNSCNNRYGGSLNHFPVVPGSVMIQGILEPEAYLETFVDNDHDGLLHSSQVGNTSTGFVNYYTGVFSVQFLFSVMTNTDVQATYLAP